MKHKVKYGMVTTDKTRHSTKGGVVRYAATCDCGGSVLLTAEQLDLREELGTGCMGLCCSHSPIELAVWHNAETALWVQHSLLFAKRPDLLADAWGGTAYGFNEFVDQDDGFKAMYNSVKDLVDEVTGAWWLYRINDSLPFDEFNVKLLPAAPEGLLEPDGIYLRYGDAVLSTAELAESLDVDEQYLVQLKAERVPDAKIIELAITRSRHG